MIKLKMSLNQTVAKVLNEAVNNFIRQIAIKYNLDQNELMSEWDGTTTSKIKSPANKSSTPDTAPITSDNMDETTLSQYKKADLQALCRQKALKCTGTKEQLIGYLLGKDSASTSVKTPPKKEAPVKKVIEDKSISTPVAKKLTSSIPTVAIRRNQHGNHEHPDTSLVFDKKTKKAIGKQNEDGTIDDLTPEDIDICNKWKFQYVLPSNLDKKTALKDVKVDELDYEDDEVLESDEEVLEEELIEDEIEEEEEEEYEDDDVDYE
jgi:hypothetical protein